MLVLEIPGREMWDEGRQEFLHEEGLTVELEHSLASISKWESRWNKIFLSQGNKTDEELRDYIRCMAVSDFPEEALDKFSTSDVDRINEYISAPMTATRITSRTGKFAPPPSEEVSSEVIYYLVFSYGIPIEVEHWHLNRLLTLIEVFNVKNSPQKKMSDREVSERYAMLNAARKKRLAELRDAEAGDAP